MVGWCLAVEMRACCSKIVDLLRPPPVLLCTFRALVYQRLDKQLFPATNVVLIASLYYQCSYTGRVLATEQQLSKAFLSCFVSYPLLQESSPF